MGSGLPVAGQIVYRMRDQLTGQPVPDTDTAADWAQSTTDVINGRKVRYPGWDLDAFFFTTQVTETAIITLTIAPDNAYEAIVAQIDQAQNRPSTSDRSPSKASPSAKRSSAPPGAASR